MLGLHVSDMPPESHEIICTPEGGGRGSNLTVLLKALEGLGRPDCKRYGRDAYRHPD